MKQKMQGENIKIGNFYKVGLDVGVQCFCEQWETIKC